MYLSLFFLKFLPVLNDLIQREWLQLCIRVQVAHAALLAAKEVSSLFLHNWLILIIRQHRYRMVILVGLWTIIILLSLFCSRLFLNLFFVCLDFILNFRCCLILSIIQEFFNIWLGSVCGLGSLYALTDILFAAAECVIICACELRLSWVYTTHVSNIKLTPVVSALFVLCSRILASFRTL